MRLRSALILLLLLLPCLAAQQSSNFDLYAGAGFTGGARLRPEPKMGLLRDAANNAIGNACISGASGADLAKLGIENLDERLQKLLSGNVLVLHNGRYFLSFPVLVGEQHQRLEATVNAAASSLTPKVVSILDELRQALPDRQEMMFHLLWSRIMDRLWWRAWKQAFHQGTPPTTEWRMYPDHPLMVGTNFYDFGAGDASFGITWNPRTNCNSRLVFSSQDELNRGAWGLTVDTPRAGGLQQLGLFDANMKFEGFAYHRGDHLDKLFKKLSDQYADVVARAYDYEQLGKTFNISAGELFLIIQHETAYAILENLSRTGKLQVPAVLIDPTDLRGCRSVFSIMLVKKPKD